MKNQNTQFYIPRPYVLGCLTKIQEMNRDLVVRCLHWSGDLYDSISEQDRQFAWLLADGFGKGLSLQHIDEYLQWDWSHIRDSTPEAIEEIAAMFRRAGYDRPRKRS